MAGKDLYQARSEYGKVSMVDYRGRTMSCLILTKPSLRRPSRISDLWTSSLVGSLPCSK